MPGMEMKQCGLGLSRASTPTAWHVRPATRLVKRVGRYRGRTGLPDLGNVLQLTIDALNDDVCSNNFPPSRIHGRYVCELFI